MTRPTHGQRRGYWLAVTLWSPLQLYFARLAARQGKSIRDYLLARAEAPVPRPDAGTVWLSRMGAGFVYIDSTSSSIHSSVHDGSKSRWAKPESVKKFVSDGRYVYVGRADDPVKLIRSITTLIPASLPQAPKGYASPEVIRALLRLKLGLSILDRMNILIRSGNNSIVTNTQVTEQDLVGKEIFR